ncbi:hypothetical protein Tco_1448558 [Tanacetum coccineum]
MAGQRPWMLVDDDYVSYLGVHGGRNFFNGAQEGDRKIAWVKWHTVLAAKQFGGLGVSSFFALNRGLLAKWVWRFLSQDNSLWYQVISTIHGSGSSPLATAYPSNWSTIIKEFNSLKEQGCGHLLSLQNLVYWHWDKVPIFLERDRWN